MVKKQQGRAKAKSQSAVVTKIKSSIAISKGKSSKAKSNSPKSSKKSNSDSMVDWSNLEYHKGFGNHIESEAEKGALPQG